MSRQLSRRSGSTLWIHDTLLFPAPEESTRSPRNEGFCMKNLMNPREEIAGEAALSISCLIGGWRVRWKWFNLFVKPYHHGGEQWN